jgi:predicted SprT family Zn-dependent metalloprotease
MPRYQYSCETCGIKDAKLFEYKEIDGKKEPFCIHCKEKLERKFLRPPGDWFNRIRQP